MNEKKFSLTLFIPQFLDISFFSNKENALSYTRKIYMLRLIIVNHHERSFREFFPG